MKTIKLITIIIFSIILQSCGPLKPVTVVKNKPIENFKYIYISPTKSLTSSSGGVYGGDYGLYGSSTSKSVNPSDVISGILTKQGFIRLPELKDDLINEIASILYAQPLAQEQVDSLKASHGITNPEWQNEYLDYSTGNTSLEPTINNKLKGLVKTMLKMPEFYLM